MNTALSITSLVPLLPEIVLGLGAMALLMLGVFRAERSVVLIDSASIVLLVAAGVIVLLLPEGRLVTFDGSFVVDGFARFLKILAIARLGGSHPDVDRLCAAAKAGAVRIFRADRAYRRSAC